MSFARSLFTVSSFTILSRLTGFLRDTMMAMILGAGPVADAFFVAQRLPNLFRSLFAEGAFSAAFVPLYTTERQKNGSAAARRFTGEAMALLLSALLPFTALMMIFMPGVMMVIAPGFNADPVKFGLAVKFSLITFPYLTLISITCLQGAVLNAQGRFASYAAAPISFNVVMILGLIVVEYFHFEAGYILSWACLAGGVVQMVWLAISCHKAGTPIPWVLPRLSDSSKKLFRRIVPGALGAGAVQVNVLLSTILASTLPTGIVSCLSYADRLNQLPLGVVGMAVGTTLLPVLSRHIEDGNEDHVRHFLSRALEFCFLLGMPAAVGLGIAARPIVQTLFEHGAFGARDTMLTAQALAAYTVGIPAYLIVRTLSSAFYARHDTKTPVKYALIAMVTNVGGALLLIGPLQHIGIALAGSIASWVNVVCLIWGMRRWGPIIDSRFKAHLPRVLICTLGMGLVAWAVTNYTQGWFTGHLLDKIIGLGIIIGSSSVVYGLLLQVTGTTNLREIPRLLRRKGRTAAQDETGLED